MSMRMPQYWMYETSGVLRAAVEAYVQDRPLHIHHLLALRAYLRQWITSPVWDWNPHATETDREILAELRDAIERLQTRQAIELWLYDAVALGMDPL
jgi:hypothetical protein